MKHQCPECGSEDVKSEPHDFPTAFLFGDKIFHVKVPTRYHECHECSFQYYDNDSMEEVGRAIEKRRGEMLIEKAAAFAEKCHAGQTRKYTGQPYFTHPKRVASYVEGLAGSTCEMIAAAYLHDVVEDCGVTVGQIAMEFGVKVAMIVEALTSKTKDWKESRATRKMIDIAILARQPVEIQRIKLVDRLDNLQEMSPAEKSFKDKYSNESIELATALRAAEPQLADLIIRLAKGNLACPY